MDMTIIYIIGGEMPFTLFLLLNEEKLLLVKITIKGNINQIHVWKE